MLLTIMNNQPLTNITINQLMKTINKTTEITQGMVISSNNNSTSYM